MAGHTPGLGDARHPHRLIGDKAHLQFKLGVTVLVGGDLTVRGCLTGRGAKHQPRPH